MKARFDHLLALLLVSQFCNAQADLKLWYNKPAAVWTEALPVGNGRFGGMVFGGVREELIQLNEATLWSGGPIKTNVNPTSAQNLQPLRSALFSGNYEAANALAKKMQGLYSESFMPLGDLTIKQFFTDSTSSNPQKLNLAETGWLPFRVRFRLQLLHHC